MEHRTQQGKHNPEDQKDGEPLGPASTRKMIKSERNKPQVKKEAKKAGFGGRV